MQLYAEYLKSREGFSVLTREHGFATYKRLDDGNIYLRDIFVSPKSREKGLAREMADEICKIGKIMGAKKLLGSVALNDPEATRNLKVLLAYEMVLAGVDHSKNLIFFTKEI